jgi:protein gp37
MGTDTAIQWCDHTFNPWIGCTKVSEGCKNCYAETNTSSRVFGVKWGAGQERHRTGTGYWRLPLKWSREATGATRRPKVFCASLADVFDPDVPRQWRQDLFETIDRTPNLDWLLLTKRPEYIRTLWPFGFYDAEKLLTWPNVWLGVSVENQQRADERIPELLKIPAAVRFVSYEPALGPVSFRRYLPHDDCDQTHPTEDGDCAIADGAGQIDWIIVGGESGKGARPFNVEWARSTIAECKAAGVSCFVKQLGSFPYDPHAVDHLPQNTISDPPTEDDLEDVAQCLEYMTIRLHHPKGGDPSEWPEDLRVREFPQPTAANAHRV